ncbi:MAG: hypothetical protein ACKOQ2_29440, partial [Dolichospermum sp.]
MRPSTRLVVLGKKLWTPAQISTALWLDAADASTIILNGSTVSQWRDKSGNGRHVSQATAANQPLFVTNQLNGLPVIRNVSADTLIGGASELGANTPMLSMFALVKNPTANPSGSGFLLSVLTNTVTTTRAALLQFANNVNLTLAGRRLDTDAFQSVQTSTTYASTQNQWIIQEGQFNYAAAELNAWLNGTNTLNAAPFQTAGNTSNTNSFRHCIFSLDGFDYALDGTEIAEALIVQGNLSTTDRQLIEGYLAWKWGLTANLPDNHPFKFNPPLV